jgi:N-dimethylarginine dimethylaminohydrolase
MTGRRTALMGDPRFFRIKGGANPHTRDRWGVRKSVDNRRAASQWENLKSLLTGLGVRVHVLPPREESTGMVFPANAGFLTRLLQDEPASQKIFLLSRPVAARAGETAVYREAVSSLGFRTAEIPYRFEGEADLFPAGDVYVFTSGPLERQRFAPRWGWPPYRRVYGFRSDPGALDALRPFCEKPILPLTLVRETHYHGDTCLCAFGPRREFLMAYLPGLDEASRASLRDSFKEKLLPLSEEDGLLFSANSFQVEGSEPVLVMPHTAGDRLKSQVRERGVRVETADVSEFMSKGGGSVKCMIGDLGVL